MIATQTPTIRFVGLLAALAATAAVFLGSADAMAAPALNLSVSAEPASGIAAAGRGQYRIDVSNTGTTETSEPVTVKFELPSGSGLEITGVTDALNELIKQIVGFGIPSWSCAVEGAGQAVSCTGPEFEGSQYGIPPGETACVSFAEALGAAVPCTLIVKVKAQAGLERGTVTPIVTACGGGVSSCPTSAVTVAEPTPTWLSFDIIDFESPISDEASNPYTQAGGRPHDILTSFEFTRTFSSEDEDPTNNYKEQQIPSEQMKNVRVELPRGFIGNPAVASRCTEDQLTNGPSCPSDSQVGTVNLLASDGSTFPTPYAIYNMVPAAGQPAEFGFSIEGLAWIHFVPRVRSDGDYGITVSVENINQWVPITGATTIFWGVPASPVHDAERNGPGCLSGCPSTLDLKPFLSMPTSCSGPITTTLRADSWKHPDDFVSSEVSNPGIDGCNALDFSPTLEARPTTTAADSPSGLDVDVHTPQNDDPEGTAEAHLKDTTVTLPEGFVINPASANGLEGCSPAQVDLHGGNPDNCPDASKVGTVEIETPLIDHPLPGSVYVATPHDNPFDSLIAIYITADDPKTGVVIKLAGEVKIDQQSGRLTTTVEEAPQLPFEHFRLHFKSGAGAPLRTPVACATYQTTSSMTPWTAPDSGPPATPSDTYAISQGANGGNCVGSEAEQPISPDLDAGTVSPVAGTWSPFVLNLSRADGTQQFSAVTLSPPPGFTGKLAGIEQCSDAALAAAASKSGKQEQSAPSCPAASSLGATSAGAGAGPAPYHAKGTAYLAGPYKGAPLSMAIVTPAVAGPFDLGTIVVRVALHIDRNSARITAVSDPIPTILQGIPLDVRTVQVRLDRERFSRNGTSCDPLSVDGQLTTVLGRSTSLSERFQLGECSALAFKPKLAIRLFGGTKRGGHPALRATLQMPEGGANIDKAVVALPHSEFLDQGHIGTVCTRVQFAAKECPAGSIYGQVTATSPLVDYPLQGNVYLRSSDNELPDLVMALHGPPSQPIEVDAVGRIDSVKGGIRSTFEGVPDIPVSGLVLNMAGGKKGLLENSTNICKSKNKATAEFDGQNGKVSDFKVLLKNGKCGKSGKAKKRAAARRAARRRAAR